jgi:hypothetical protein
MIINYLINNDLVFYGMFAGTVGFIGYKCVSSYLNSFYEDKGIQTEAWEDYSNRPSQIGSNSATSLDTVTPISENISPTFTTRTISEVGTLTTTDGTSTVTTVLPVPLVNIETVPNSDIIELNTLKSLQESKFHEINELFSKEFFHNVITEADLTYIIKGFTISEINSANINELILSIIECFNG